MANNLEKRVEQLEQKQELEEKFLIVGFDRFGEDIQGAQFGERHFSRDNGETVEEFCERVRSLLHGETGIVWIK